MIIEGEIARAGTSAPGWLEVVGERIVAAGGGTSPRPAEMITDMLLAPGYVDLQVNGAVGVEVTGGAEALEEIDRFQLSHGVTSYLPTIITTDPATAERAVEEIAAKAADNTSPVAGVHLEGPFLNPEWCGVHRPDLLQIPADGAPAYYEHPAVRLVTLAPELPGAPELIATMKAQGCAVAIGHCSPDTATIETALDAGATLVTHLFNGMPPFHHRSPGLAGWALTHDRLTVSVIADNVHLAPDTLALVRRAASERVILVTDASVVAGLTANEEHQQAGISVHLREDGRAVTDASALAGSAVALDECVRRWATSTGASLPEAIDAASTRPARAIGLDADLRPGAFADLLLLDDRGVVRRTMRRGDWISY